MCSSTSDCAPLSIADTLSCDSYVADVYTELILRFARSIKSGAGTLFKARLSPWATGGPGKKTAVEGEEPEVIDTEPKKLEWSMSHELKMAVVRFPSSPRCKGVALRSWFRSCANGVLTWFRYFAHTALCRDETFGSDLPERSRRSRL